jgi:hypothetical protein
MQSLTRTRCSASAAALLVVIATRASAQSPVQRAAIEAFRDSLATVPDSTTLLGIERRGIEHARRELRDSALAHVRLGFVALRLGDVAGRKHFEDAASEFQWTIDLQPKWPYGWLGLGLAELGIGDAEFALLRGLQTALGKDALTRSADDFAHSAAVDPSFTRGLVELANTALRQRINLRLDVALAALRRSVATPAGHDPQVELARARVEREVGSPDSALVAVNALIAAQPTDATALLELARVRFALGRNDGNPPWYRGLAVGDTAATALYRDDLQFILPDSTLHAFDAATGSGRAALMRHFWSLRDQDELHTPGDRLMEHYRRLAYARRAYRLATTHRHYDIVERYRPPTVDFDDRGVIYIRHGPPDDRVSLDLPGLPLNESWVYHRPGQPDLLFHFVAREDVTDYRLVESALDILGYENALRLAGTGDVQGNDAPTRGRPSNQFARVSLDSAARLRQRATDVAMSSTAEEIFRSRLPLNPIYQRLLSSGPGGATGLLGEERTLGSRSIRIGTTTDDWRRHYQHPLPASIRVYAMAADSVSAQLRVAFAVPMSATPNTAGVLRVRASALAVDGTSASTLDSVITGTSVASAQGVNDAVGVATFPVAPGSTLVRVGAETGHAGVTSARDTLEVTAPNASKLGLSDIVLGRRSMPVDWIASTGDTVRADPTAEFSRDEPMELFAEVFRPPANGSCRIELVVRHPGHRSIFQRLAGVFGASSVVLRVAFSGRGSGGTMAIKRDIDLHSLSPGHYVMEMTVSAPGSASATRREDFSVRP